MSKMRRSSFTIRTGSVDTGYLSHRCVDDPSGLRSEVRQELMQHLKDYMHGFMDDAAYVSKGDEPSGRASWPDKDGNPTDAWNSPLAHRKFFEWRAGGPGAGIDADGVRALLDSIGVDQTICSTSVADGIIHGMDKGADDNVTKWPEYLNSIFRLGPVADTPSEDPTIAQLAAEGTPATPAPSGGGRMFLGGVLAAVEKAAAKGPRPSTAIDLKSMSMKPGFRAPDVLAEPLPHSNGPAVAGAVVAGGLLALGAPIPLAAVPIAIGLLISYGDQRRSA